MTDFVPNCVAQLVREGFHATRVECRSGRWSRDLFHFGDVLGIRCQPELFDTDSRIRIAIVQVTSTSNFASRKKKIEQFAGPLMHEDVHIECWGYTKSELKRRERYWGEGWTKVI